MFLPQSLGKVAIGFVKESNSEIRNEHSQDENLDEIQVAGCYARALRSDAARPRCYVDRWPKYRVWLCLIRTWCLDGLHQTNLQLNKSMYWLRRIRIDCLSKARMRH